MKLFTWKEHFLELKKRVILVMVFFIGSFLASYYFSDVIFLLLLAPLQDISDTTHRIIYTGLTEAFLTYVKLSAYTAFYFSIPFMALQFYKFLSPGLYRFEKKILIFCLCLSLLLFYSGSYFVYEYVMPKAWTFFLSFENKQINTPIVLEAKISEYIALVLQLILAFGLAFQLPIIMVIMSLLGIINADYLKKKRRFSIVIIFIIAAIFTPPDVISQIAMAIPMLILYELSIFLCRVIEKNLRI